MFWRKRVCRTLGVYSKVFDIGNCTQPSHDLNCSMLQPRTLFPQIHTKCIPFCPTGPCVHHSIQYRSELSTFSSTSPSMTLPSNKPGDQSRPNNKIAVWPAKLERFLNLQESIPATPEKFAKATLSTPPRKSKWANFRDRSYPIPACADYLVRGSIILT